MISLVVETPLANDQICPGVLNALDHVGELFLFVFPEFLVFIDRCNVQLVLRLGTWGFKGTSEDGKASVFD